MADHDREVATDDGPEDPGGVNRQVMLGGVVVVLTLAIAAWLAYGVVQRSSTNPRAAGLVPDGSPGALHGRATTDPSIATSGTTTSTQGGASTSAPTRPGTSHSGSSGAGAQPPGDSSSPTF